VFLMRSGSGFISSCRVMRLISNDHASDGGGTTPSRRTAMCSWRGPTASL
jgi:hypothetical protein